MKSTMWDYFSYRTYHYVVIIDDGLPACKVCHNKMKKEEILPMFHHLQDNHLFLDTKVKVNTQ